MKSGSSSSSRTTMGHDSRLLFDAATTNVDEMALVKNNESGYN
ncbi:MAG: hypothetical protein PHE50_02500 [Dehalococcoidales bacterium]|nr:hypothetical protein [Dehalococcoidales bacterium]